MTNHRRARATTVSLLTGLLVAVLLTAPGAQASTAPVPVPDDGRVSFGVNLDWVQDSPAAYIRRAGVAPAQYGDFVHLPLTSGTKAALSARVDTVKAQQARLFLTVEPGALSNVTPAAVDDLATTLAGYNARGVPVLLRFAHEMNGSWYAWGQQPTRYVSAFRMVADAVHAKAPGTAMVWAPNYGGGYPYTGGAYSARSGTADFTALDTDRNGRLTMADDPYTPYYPGDAYVDWVGLTAYHFGHAWPWGENEVPEAGKLAQFLRGTYTGNGKYENQSALPDFYQSFAVARAKPMVITETGALYNEAPPVPGAAQVDIQRAWLQQVYGSAARDEFPLIKMINWFEIRKYEGETASVIDWRATANPVVLASLREHVTAGRYLFAGDAAPSPSPTPTEPTPTEPVPTEPVPTDPGPAQPAPPPGPVTALTSSSAATKVSVTWRAPAAAGALTGYRACLGTSVCVDLPRTTTSATFDGLQRRTDYTVHVRALDGDVVGPQTSVVARTK